MSIIAHITNRLFILQYNDHQISALNETQIYISCCRFSVHAKGLHFMLQVYISSCRFTFCQADAYWRLHLFLYFLFLSIHLNILKKKKQSIKLFMLFHTVNWIVYISFVNIQFSFYATKLVINYISDRALRIGDIQAVCFFDMQNINSGMLYIQVLFQLNLTQVPYRKENLADSMLNLAFYH